MNANITRKTAQILFFVNAAIWLCFCIVSLVRIGNNNSVPVITLFVVAILMFGNAGAMLAAGITIGQGNRWYYYFAVTLLVVNIILTFTDQFGILDLLTLIIDLITLGLVLISNKAFLRPA